MKLQQNASGLSVDNERAEKATSKSAGTASVQRSARALSDSSDLQDFHEQQIGSKLNLRQIKDSSSPNNESGGPTLVMIKADPN